MQLSPPAPKPIRLALKLSPWLQELSPLALELTQRLRRFKFGLASGFGHAQNLAWAISNSYALCGKIAVLCGREAIC